MTNSIVPQEWDPSREDILAIGRWLIDPENWLTEDDWDHGTGAAQCQLCEGLAPKWCSDSRKIRHSDECPFPVALDLMTGVVVK